MTISDTARNLLALAEKVQMASAAYEELRGANDVRCLVAANAALDRACSMETIAALARGCLEAERDAERYRFWRKHYRSPFVISLPTGMPRFDPGRPQVEVFGPDYEQKIDAAIDAAIATRGAT